MLSIFLRCCAVIISSAFPAHLKSVISPYCRHICERLFCSPAFNLLFSALIGGGIPKRQICINCRQWGKKRKIFCLSLSAASAPFRCALIAVPDSCRICLPSIYAREIAIRSQPMRIAAPFESIQYEFFDCGDTAARRILSAGTACKGKKS